MSGITIRQESLPSLATYGNIPIAFTVVEVYEVTNTSDGTVRLTLRPVPEPYVKDYDAISERPAEWPDRFDVSHWAVFSADVDGQRVGGAVVAWRTPTLHLLHGRDDLALLWDIRIHPDHRRQGTGSALFAAAEAWAVEQGCTELRVETQNINVPACRFYARQGCEVVEANAGSYEGLPNEIQLIWRKRLDPEAPRS